MNKFFFRRWKPGKLEESKEAWRAHCVSGLAGGEQGERQDDAGGRVPQCQQREIRISRTIPQATQIEVNAA